MNVNHVKVQQAWWRFCSVALIAAAALIAATALAGSNPVDVMTHYGFLDPRAAVIAAIESNNVELACAAISMADTLNFGYNVAGGWFSSRTVTPLGLAIERGVDPDIIDTLLQYGADPNDCLLTNNTPALFIAVQRNMTNVLATLYASGADLSQSLPSGDTALHVAATSNHVEAVEVLLRLGVPLDSTNMQGKTALDLAPTGSALQQFLRQQKLRRDWEQKEATLYGGLPSNVTMAVAANELMQGGWTDDMPSFMKAVAGNNERIVLCYVRSGFNPFRSERYQPLYMAAVGGSLKIVRLLIECAGAREAVDGVDDQLVAGLFVAAASNHARIVETILSEGMDADVPDDEGRNALQVAFECRAYDAAEVLIKDGAATNKRSVRVAVRAIADGATRAYLEALIARTDWELHRVQQRDKTAGPRVVGPKALTKYTDSTGITMVYVPSGSFIMGSPANEYERNTDEGPQRYVYVSGFWMDECEVTQESYERLMGENPSQYKDRRYPVDSVPWETAIEYCNKRSELEGLVPVYSDKGVDWNSGGYRLPTEAEWEYACRADTRTPFSTGESIDITQANYDGREPYLASQRAQPRNAWEAIKHATAYKGCPIPVKSMLANPWGLYDMHGNVCEWVGDGYAPYDITATNNPLGASNGPCPVLRGGSWYHAARSLRSARRINLSVEQTMAGCIGFRCVRTSHKNIPLVTQGLATEMAFRNILGDYSPTLVVPKNMLITNDLASAVAKLRKGFVWPCASCGALNEALSHHVGEPELCQCGQGAVISGVRSCSIAACPQCGVKHNIVRGSQGLYSCRSCRAPFLVANQATRMYAAARRYLPQFTALAREILSVRTKGVIAVMPLAATEQVTRAQAEYLALSLLSALNDALVTVAQDVSIVDRAATGQVMNELQLQKLYGDPQTRKQIGQQTNADMLLIGNTQIAEDVILLTVRITDVESGEQLLTRTISIPLTPRLRYLGKK